MLGWFENIDRSSSVLFEKSEVPPNKRVCDSFSSLFEKSEVPPNKRVRDSLSLLFHFEMNEMPPNKRVRALGRIDVCGVRLSGVILGCSGDCGGVCILSSDL